MSGHSHWAKIKRAKASVDAKRGQAWSKLARRIIVAAKVGGGNPDENLQLRYAIDEAKAENMPRDTIANAVKKGTGALGAQNYERIMYEGYGPGGVAVMVDCLTDNRSRTAPEMRKIFERAGGQLGANGCVGWMFAQKGSFLVPLEGVEEDRLMEICLDAGADDVKRDGDEYSITSEPGKYQPIKDALTAANITIISSQIGMVPANTVTIGEDKAHQVLTLMEALEDHEDVQNVFANFEIPDEIAAKLGS